MRSARAVLQDLRFPRRRGRRERLVDRPSTLQAQIERRVIKMEPLAPRRQGQRLLSIGERVIVTFVSLLDLGERPDAVPGRVRAVVVLPFEHVAIRRARSHVSIEGFNARAPSLAHDNAAPAIQRKRLAARIVAAATRAVPHAVFRPLVGFRRQTVGEILRRAYVPTETAATLCISTEQVRLHDRDAPAVTSTPPAHRQIAAPGRHTIEHDQPPKPLAAFVDHGHRESVSSSVFSPGEMPCP